MRKASMIAMGLALAALGAATSLFAKNLIEARGAVMEIESAPPILISNGGGGESGIPLQPQVAQILSNVSDDSSAAALKRREAAEQKLVEMGASAADSLKQQIGSAHGAARDVLIVAVFRLENAPLSPQQLIGQWAGTKANVDPATIVLHHFSADDLRRLFPHHLFYVAEKKADAAGKNGLASTLVALAADGKVQPLTDDAELAHFLKIELPQTSGKLEQRRAAAAAAELALARQSLPAGEIFSDAKLTDAGATATARFAAANAPSVSVAVNFSANERVASVATTVIAPRQHTEAVTNPTATAPEGRLPETHAAETAPASRPVRRIRHLHPIPPVGPEPFTPYNGPMLR